MKDLPCYAKGDRFHSIASGEPLKHSGQRADMTDLHFRKKTL